ncbi:lyase family protein [Phenylobacterium sp.]|uniref:lyase family protein n=1 Tax=Phenylobacterium sp. TaxID=1871053 RepID=UPI0039187CB5
MTSAPPQYSHGMEIGPCVYCGSAAGARPLHIGWEAPPATLLSSLALVRGAAAHANGACGALSAQAASAIEEAALEVSFTLSDQWRRSVWQDGAGAGLAYPVDIAIAQAARRRAEISAMDVRRHQCADAFLTAAHAAALLTCERDLLPAVDELSCVLETKASAWSGVIKIGRTHLQDAAPLTLGQEMSGYLQQARNGHARLRAAAEALRHAPLGQGCLGTGSGVPAGFSDRAVARLCDLTGLRLKPAPLALADLAGPGALAFMHAALAALAAALFKISSDVSLLASGPRAGFNELRGAESGLVCASQPGKSNPDAAEALAQVCVLVMGADSAVAVAASQGHFERNAFLPLLAFNVLRSTRLLADAVRVFTRMGLAGLEPRTDVLARNVAHSVMLVTALAPHIGYDSAARIARNAYRRNLSLREAALASGLVDAATFDRLVRPERMLGPEGS